jgi:hypothetical protein
LSPFWLNCHLDTIALYIRKVYEPLKEMPWNVPEMEIQQFFPDEGPRGLEDDLIFL